MILFWIFILEQLAWKNNPLLPHILDIVSLNFVFGISTYFLFAEYMPSIYDYFFSGVLFSRRHSLLNMFDLTAVAAKKKEGWKENKEEEETVSWRRSSVIYI